MLSAFFPNSVILLFDVKSIVILLANKILKPEIPIIPFFKPAIPSFSFRDDDLIFLTSSNSDLT